MSTVARAARLDVRSRRERGKTASVRSKPAPSGHRQRGGDADSTASTAGPLSPDALRKIDAYWRASNYLSVGQIYLLDNPLLQRHLERQHIKPRLLGHWGTTPVDPLISWSRYPDQLRPFFDEHVRPGWTGVVREVTELLHKGDAIYQMMQVIGEEGVSLGDFVIHQKALVLDMVYLQQDAFDGIDASTPQDRQTAAFELVRTILQRDYPFADREEARRFFTELTGLFKNLNYAAQGSPEHAGYLAQIEQLLTTLGRDPTASNVAAAPRSSTDDLASPTPPTAPSASQTAGHS